MNVAVVYLAWLPYGISYFNEFLDSYLSHPAGYEHKLVIVLNGIGLSEKELVKEFKLLPGSKNIINVEFLEFDKGQDIEIYQKTAPLIDTDCFLFLNTYSQFENKDWLRNFVKNWKDGIGIIGATGSYASYLSSMATQTKFTWKSNKPLNAKIRELKYLIKLFLFQRNRFKNFPAPHVRTTAFFTSKKIFCSLKKELLEDKMQAYYFENGTNSMTMQILAMGYKCQIMDKFGNVYDIKDWPRSKIFWTGDQEDLLISDNQTKKYAASSGSDRRLYQMIAWNREG